MTVGCQKKSDPQKVKVFKDKANKKSAQMLARELDASVTKTLKSNIIKDEQSKINQVRSDFSGSRLSALSGIVDSNENGERRVLMFVKIDGTLTTQETNELCEIPLVKRDDLVVGKRKSCGGVSIELACVNSDCTTIAFYLIPLSSNNDRLKELSIAGVMSILPVVTSDVVRFSDKDKATETQRGFALKIEDEATVSFSEVISGGRALNFSGFGSQNAGLVVARAKSDVTLFGTENSSDVSVGSVEFETRPKALNTLKLSLEDPDIELELDYVLAGELPEIYKIDDDMAVLARKYLPTQL